VGWGWREKEKERERNYRVCSNMAGQQTLKIRPLTHKLISFFKVIFFFCMAVLFPDIKCSEWKRNITGRIGGRMNERKKN
jgi:hypothetical protein